MHVTVIAVAGGVKKALAILAALRGGYLDVLMTDTVVATTVLNLEGASNEAVANPNLEVPING